MKSRSGVCRLSVEHQIAFFSFFLFVHTTLRMDKTRSDQLPSCLSYDIGPERGSLSGKDCDPPRGPMRNLKQMFASLFMPTWTRSSLPVDVVAGRYGKFPPCRSHPENPLMQSSRPTTD